MSSGGSTARGNRTFYRNIVALALLLLANYLWAVRYTSLLDASDTALWALNGGLFVGALIWIKNQLFGPLIPKADMESVKNLIVDVLSRCRLYVVIGVFFFAEWLLSLWMGGLELTNPAGGAQSVAYKEDGKDPTEKEWTSWDGKKPTHFGPRLMSPFSSKDATVFVKGVPRKAVQIRPWWRAGEAFRLEYPRDFLRPVVLVMAEMQIVKEADKAVSDKKPWKLRVAFGSEKPIEVEYDGRPVWIACGEAEQLPIPSDVLQDIYKQWGEIDTKLMLEKALRPRDYPEFRGLEIPAGTIITASLDESSVAVPGAVVVYNPTSVNNQVHPLRIVLPKSNK